MKSLLVFGLLTVVFIGTASSTRADTFVFVASLSGPAEAPPNASPGTGSAIVTYDNVTHMMRVQATFGGLLGNTTAAHIHAPTPTAGTGTAGVATEVPSFAGFPLGVTSGSMDNTFNLTLAQSWNPAFITANGGTPATAEAAFFSFVIQGRSYFNIHTTSFGGGEIRGFLQPVPEPVTLVLLGSGLVGLAAHARRKRRLTKKNEL